MDRALAIVPAGRWDPAQAADRVLLDCDGRRRRRAVLTGEGGLRVLLDLAASPALRDGDALALEDGRLVAVAAAPERLVEALANERCTLARIAWHVGNRHVPVEIRADRLRFRFDPVLADMVRALGAEARILTAPFEPEAGAYAGEHHHA
jgi:urease accessory protein